MNPLIRKKMSTPKLPYLVKNAPMGEPGRYSK